MNRYQIKLTDPFTGPCFAQKHTHIILNEILFRFPSQNIHLDGLFCKLTFPQFYLSAVICVYTARLFN